MRRLHRDFDRFDSCADHLLISDTSHGREDIIGTYRLLRQKDAIRAGGFYSADEFDIGALLAQTDGILELGRSCIAAPYRSGRAIRLLWQAIAAYVFHYDIAFMFGCASLPGTDPDALSAPLAYLHHFHRAPTAVRPRALSHRYVEMNRLAKDLVDTPTAIRGLPPLLKGYLRLGGFVGDGAVVDAHFNATDVCIVVKTDQITRKYHRHFMQRFEPSDSRHSGGNSS